MVSAAIATAPENLKISLVRTPYFIRPDLGNALDARGAELLRELLEDDGVLGPRGELLLLLDALRVVVRADDAERQQLKSFARLPVGVQSPRILRSLLSARGSPADAMGSLAWGSWLLHAEQPC